MKLTPDRHNANKGTKRGRALLEQSLRELGAGRSILVDKDGEVIAGNKTLEAAQKLGLRVRVVPAARDELVVVQREDLDLDDPGGAARRMAYLDNRVAELDLAWDAEQVAADMEAGLTPEAMGFWEGEARAMLEEAVIGQETAGDPGSKTDQAAQWREKWGTRRGQVWQLGAHRVICGDATQRETTQRLMAGTQAALCFTSPPYWVGMSYERETSEEEIEAFIRRAAEVITTAVRRDESRIVINTGTGFTTAFNKKSKRHVLLLIDKWTDALRARGWNLRHVRHWLKEGQLRAVSPRTDMIDQHCEFLATYEEAEGAPRKFDDTFCEADVSLLLTFYEQNGKSRGQEWTGAGWALRSYWDDIKGTARANGHEAAFPVELPLRHLMLYTKRGEAVFEPFLGSGTTLIACEALGRVCYGIELDEGYLAATLERWAEATGRTPELVKEAGDEVDAGSA